MSSLARRRVVKDLQKLNSEAQPGIQAKPFSNNMMLVHAVIRGPVDSEWEAGIFHIVVKFPDEYPIKPPYVRFLSKMCHPNNFNDQPFFYPDGRICLDILQSRWSPGYDLIGILTSIQSLLSDPNPDSPASVEISKLYLEDRVEYSKMILRCVEDSWEIPNLPQDIAEELKL